MPETRKPFYLTTPIYYVNARPHIGHAYSTIVADVLARRHRLLGQDVYFLTGTDEHGQKIERSAAAANIPPQLFADQVSATFRALWDRMGITYNQFIRTTDKKHKTGVQQLFRTLYNNGHIYLASYTGSYCVSDEAFVDAPVGTPCPDCGRPLEEVTEENFFFRLSAFQLPLLNLIESNQLIITPDSSRNEVHRFLQGPLHNAINQAAVALRERGLIDEGKEFPFGEAITYAHESGLIARTAEDEQYLPGALKDLSISRSSFTWGIPVPDDIQRAAGTTQNHVVYVWLDALANYITALGYGSDDETLFHKFWPADLHLVGKEITRFHCVYWPAFLLGLNSHWEADASGDPHQGHLVLHEDATSLVPKQVTANGWLLFDNSKMSKSKGNVVRTETILSAFGTLCPPSPTPSDIVILSEAKDLLSSNAPQTPTAHDRDLFAADVLRYYLLREIPFGQDGSFSFDSLITRYNADLANGYGNLVSRTLNMITQYFGGVISPRLHELHHNDFSAAENAALYADIGFGRERLAEIENFLKNWDAKTTAFSQGLVLIQSLVKWTDDILSVERPWKERNTPEATEFVRTQILYQAAESIRIITALLYPILPYATARVWQQLGLGDIELAAKNGELTNLQWGGLKPGTKLGPLGPIFPRAPKELAQTMIDIEENNVTPKPSETTSPDAAPRTSTLPEPATTLPVAGSTALTTGPDPVPAPAAPSTLNPAPSTLDPVPSPQITIDDFAKLDLRVAQITLAERIPKADKLLRLEVDLGPLGTRQILSGIAEFYTPEELTGRRIVVIANLAPRKMRGLESHGMLLAASDPDAGDHGKPHLATCGPDIALGARLK